MKQCPKCNKDHDKPGIFCCRSCANSRVFTIESKVKKANSNKLYYETADPVLVKHRVEKASATYIKNKNDKIIAGDFNSLSNKMKREQILHEQNQKCNICKIGQIWNNSPLTFHLDHISGNRQDESRSNLQMICPNCHSQTETYGGKNGTKITNKQIEDAILISDNNYHICIKLGLNPSSYAYDRINKIRKRICSNSTMA